MKSEYSVMVILVVATAVYGSRLHSRSTEENRSVDAKERGDTATDSQQGNTAVSATKNSADPNEDVLNRWRRLVPPPCDGEERSEFHSFSSFSVWKPPVYQLNRPYFIPIYGNDGKMPIYFAPQPFNQHNKPPYVGPAYLPPKEEPTKEYTPPVTQKPTTTLKSRFGYPDNDDDDDRPTWSSGKTTSAIKEATESPMSDTDKAINDVFNKKTDASARPGVRQPSRTTTARPLNVPSNCEWAIVSCCLPGSSTYPEQCFSQRGCPGPFFGKGPCDKAFTQSAVEALLKFYRP